MGPLRFIDSHTEGEPTRVITAGGPNLGTGSMAERKQRLAKHFDNLRTTCLLEPRGHDAMVGALLCPPSRSDCAAGVIFFNNAGYLGMCGHGAIGVAVTLAHMRDVDCGPLQLETPVGIVKVNLNKPNEASIENVPSFRFKAAVKLSVPGLGEVEGDIAWGGNWFFLASQAPHSLSPGNCNQLVDAASRIKQALHEQGIRAEDEADIDHVEFFGPAQTDGANSRNFVLCPGGAYDRSPCGTGTSAKLACLAADGKLEAGQTWVQESIIGSRFICHYNWLDEKRITATISGRAFVCATGDLIVQAEDPFAHGIQTT